MKHKILHFIGMIFVRSAMLMTKIANWFLALSVDYRTDMMHKQIIGWKETAFVVQRKYRQHLHIKQIK